VKGLVRFTLKYTVLARALSKQIRIAKNFEKNFSPEVTFGLQQGFYI